MALFSAESEPGDFHDLRTRIRWFVNHLIDGIEGITNGFTVGAAQESGHLFEPDTLLVVQLHAEGLDRDHNLVIR